MEYLQKFNDWKTNKFFDVDTRDELSSLSLENDTKEIEDRFYCELEFGTGGLRGVMGAGTNRMNQYTVGKATKGLADYLIDTYGKDACQKRGVVIGFDTRNSSKFFSETAANVLSGMGICVYLHSSPCPTPQLSFSVMRYHALAGIVITASHNPKEYNGYKVYDEFGCQLVPWQAQKVIAYVNNVTDYTAINFDGNTNLITICDEIDDFVNAAIKQSRIGDKAVKSALKIVYTPIHGSGNVPVKQILEKDSFNNVQIVYEQDNFDGDFPTVVSPNPEDRRALELGIELAKKTDSDIVLGTDPDCDRVGVAVKTADGEYKLLTGNQIGALLMDFVLKHTNLSDYNKPAVVKTVVTSELGADIARTKGITVFSTLTGFKFVGEKITQFEQAKLNRLYEQDYDFIFGYEESYGYLAGTHARDKDAVVSSMLICEMAAEAKAEEKTLLDKMNDIYSKYGFYRDALDFFTLKGKDGLEKINFMMSNLRLSESPFKNTAQIIDYSKPVAAESGFGELPTSNVLKYILSDGSWIAVRPSGTEPKIKIYYSIKGTDEASAEKNLEHIQRTIINRLGL